MSCDNQTFHRDHGFSKLNPFEKLNRQYEGFIEMGLDKLQMAPLVPDDSMLCLFTSQGKVFVMQQETFFIRNKWRHLASCLHLIHPN